MEKEIIVVEIIVVVMWKAGGHHEQKMPMWEDVVVEVSFPKTRQCRENLNDRVLVAYEFILKN